MRGKHDEGRVSRVVQVLQETVLFTDVPAEELMPLAAGARPRSYAPHQPIAAHDFHEALLVIERGTLRLFRSCAAGNEVTLGTFSAGAVLGVSTYAPAIMATSTLEAVEQHTLVHGLSRQQVNAVLRRHPHLALRMMEQLGQQVQLLFERVEELALHPVRTRLAHELGSRARSDGRDQVHATHEELAAWIGSTQVEVSRGLRILRDERLISSTPHRRGITVLDEAKLAGY